MQVYAVRNAKSKAPVGLFWTRTVNDLFWIINEVENPFECEYQRIAWNGGAIFTSEDVVSGIQTGGSTRFTQTVYDYLDSGMTIPSQEWTPVPTRQWENFWE